MSGSELVNLVLDLRRQPWVGLMLLAVGLAFLTTTAATRFERQEEVIASKADTVALHDIAREIRDLSSKIDSLSLRQRQYFCTGKPSFCR